MDERRRPDSRTVRKYWNKLKEQLKKEGSQSVTNCHQFKMLADVGRLVNSGLTGLVEQKSHFIKPLQHIIAIFSDILPDFLKGLFGTQGIRFF